ncbi:hypothetical protein TNCT_308531 [Trichonephila clavata]|uniref:Uncharacterized protein n=1 Tax=Trichonephila clavata TaxID=2740835 RepID=A0A8X6GHU7_TRICU|nr:hypothetical protein TNCT_308531 [Trichonephila clavata]
MTKFSETTSTNFVPNMVTSPMNRDDDPSKCRCGKDDEIVPFTWRRGVSDKIIYDKNVAMEKARKEKLPLFSSNRRTVTSSEYGGE